MQDKNSKTCWAERFWSVQWIAPPIRPVSSGLTPAHSRLNKTSLSECRYSGLNTVDLRTDENSDRTGERRRPYVEVRPSMMRLHGRRRASYTRTIGWKFLRWKVSRRVVCRCESGRTVLQALSVFRLGLQRKEESARPCKVVRPSCV